ncbi:MAG: nucleotide exchange factor GrpE [Clostridia bacterium]|nr:nucleotide exchange factor GrpE [Clostridia bacterium]
MNDEELDENIVEENVEVMDSDVDVQKLQEDLDNTTDRLKRLMAEFDNYKKRASKEREQLYNSLVADIMMAFLPVMDNLEKAINTNTGDEGYKQGMELVAKQFKDVLKSFGLEEIKTEGEIFNPILHEAVSSVQDDTKESQEIIEEFRKGYKMGDKVIRHAMVVVNQ